MACLWLQMESDLEAYRVWYPPVRSSLLCLSKLYGCLDPKIFNGLAQDAVHAATVCVQVSISCMTQLSPRVSFLHMLSCMRCRLKCWVKLLLGIEVTRKTVHLFLGCLADEKTPNCFDCRLACILRLHSW